MENTIKPITPKKGRIQIKLFLVLAIIFFLVGIYGESLAPYVVDVAVSLFGNELQLWPIDMVGRLIMESAFFIMGLVFFVAVLRNMLIKPKQKSHG